MFPLFLIFIYLCSINQSDSETWDSSASSLANKLLSGGRRKITVFRPGGNYLIEIPLVIRDPYPVNVNILNSTSEFNNTVKVWLKNGNDTIGEKLVQSIRRRQPVTITLESLNMSSCVEFPRLYIQAETEAHTKLFHVQRVIKCPKPVVSLVVQTDRGIYVPVYYRIIAAQSDEGMYKGNITIKVIDQDAKPYLELTDQSLHNGVYDGSVRIVSGNSIGVWQIIVTLDSRSSSIANADKTFIAEFSVQKPNEIPQILVFDKMMEINANSSYKHSEDIIGAKDLPKL
ncbi:MG2 domain-containing protein [Ditylenchus destructor]|nr:MG2 domain-containing protein [Ditylenchus destructor]